MPSPKRSTGRRAQQMSARDFERSNSTAEAFLGGKQKAWITGQSREALSEPLSAEPGYPKSRSQGPVPDTSTSSSPQTTVQEEAMTTSTPVPISVSTKPSSTADNVLPSPSPSVDTRRQSRDFMNVTDLDDEVDSTFAPGGPLTSRLEEMVAGLSGFEQLERHAARPKDLSEPVGILADKEGQRGSRPSSESASRGRATGSFNQPPLALTDRSPVTTSSKRTQQSTTQPRKRSQIIQGPPHKDLHSQPSAPAAARTIEDVPGFTTLLAADMQNFYQQVTRQFQALTNALDRRGVDVERPRLGLLSDACARMDLFYLCLHQLFCLDLSSRLSNGRVQGLDDVHRNGLHVLSYLLVPNEQMTPEAIDWFSTFPMPIEILHQDPSFQASHLKALVCLENLAINWDVLRSQCALRRSPPLVDEMVALFKVESFILLQIIFRAILRETWKGQQDQCYHAIEAGFSTNHTDVMNRLVNPDRLPMGAVQAYNLSIITEYERILETHRHHTQPAAQNTMAPPQHAQALPRMAYINQTHQTRQPASGLGHAAHEFRSTSQNNLDIDTRAAQHTVPRVFSNPITLSPSTTTRQNAPEARIDPSSRQANSTSPYQTLPYTGLSNSHGASFTQSPTTLRGVSSPIASMNPSVQLQGQGQWRIQTTPVGVRQSLRSPSPATGSRAPVRTVLPSNAPGNSRNGPYPQQHGSPQASSQRQVQFQAPTNGNARSFPPQHARLQPEAQRPLSHSDYQVAPPLNRFIHLEPSIGPAQPNPSYSALYQAHLASPIMSTVKVKGNGSDVVKLFRFIEDVIMPPEALSKKKKHLKWSFNIDQGCISLLAQANISSDGARSTRIIQSGSRLCRIRCIRLASTAGLPSQGEWVVADHTWPDGVGIILNGKSHEVRKNSHHGKDLSIDITQFIRSGKNELTTALIGLPEGSSLRYAIGVELIRVEEEMDIKRAIPMARLEEARKRILEHSSQIDPDVQVIHAPTIINLTDPFTASQFEIPLRGSNCRHYQCFDRDVFLETRNAKDPDQPCEPEAFKCPICGLDARPPNLVIDGFLLAVKDSLQKQGRDKVKAVILREDGEWEIEKEDEATGESDDETDKQDWPQAEKLAEAGAGKASEAGQRTSREVIEIDD